MLAADMGSQTDIPGVDHVKHQFVHLSLHPDWLVYRPTIAVNALLQISYEGSSWHGSAVYTCDEEGGQWEMTFNFSADVTKMKVIVFKELKHTTSFLASDKKNKGYNGMLIPYFDH